MPRRGRVTRKRLLDNDMLAGLDGLQRHWQVHVRRHAQVDNINTVIGEHLLVALVLPRHVMVRGEALRILETSGRDCTDLRLDADDPAGGVGVE